ncbi:MAG: hypothetical protein J6T51_03520 [Kiritimatiellae bacterium]|nr:hypothetical protein [Kiritimatiellia bacterium]
MKQRLVTVMALASAFVAVPTSAAVLSTNDCEAVYEGFFVPDSADLFAITNYASGGQPSSSVPAPFCDFGNKYMALDSGDVSLWHSFDRGESDVYFDSYVQMTPSVGDISYTNDAKFVVFMDANTNLCVISGTSDSNTTPVTNTIATSSQIVPDSWHRLTIRGNVGDTCSFSIYLDGNHPSGTSTFYSLTNDKTISEIGLKGTGAIDDFVVRTTAPVFNPAAVVATIDGEDFATLSNAVAEARADVPIVLLANNSENITLAEDQTFKLKKGEFEYSGQVFTASGYRLKISDPDANGVVTYSQAPSFKPSISINFTNSDTNGLETVDDVGLYGYAVPGTSWNNFVVANNSTFDPVNATDSNGVASAMPGVSVAISGTRGSWSCSSLTAANNPLHGYVDESDAYATPTVTVSGIPYYKYRVIVYHSTDTANVPFGYDTINGTNYTYVNDALAEGTTAWGDSGAKDNANAISEGGNVLLTGELSGPTLTVVGHRGGGASNARGCIAAIQIIEVRPDAGENDLIIEVSGDTTYTVSEAKTLSGTVYVIGNGTLTLDGSAQISSATIDVSYGVTMNVNADRLDGTTYTGSGTVVYDGVVPPTGKGWTDSTWTGTVWLKNKSGITGDNNATTGVQPNSLGNSLSKVKFSGVSGWLEAPIVYNPEIVLENDSYDYALKLTNGNSPAATGENTNRCTVVKRLSGSGTLGCGGSTYAWPLLQVWDANSFTGSIDTSNPDGNGQGKTGLVVVFCAEDTVFSDTLYALFNNRGADSYPHPHAIYVVPDMTVTQGSAATWTAVDGFGVDGTLFANGTLASSAATAVSGSGTVVFTGRLPSPVDGENETKWWKNANWTGAVQIKGIGNLVGISSASGTYIDFNQYGHADSIVELNNVTGWLNPNYTCTPKFKVTGTLSLNNGYSGAVNAFKVGTLLGTGTISGSGSAPTAVFNATGDSSGFSGCVQLDSSKCVVFGSTVPNELTAGTIYINEGAVVTMQQSSGYWQASGGIKVDGELCAPNLDKFGGGTTITTSDTGVFTLINSNDTQDHDVNYARITGTGTLRYADVSGKWRTLSTVNFPTNMVCENNLSAGLILQGSGAVHTIGSLAGSGQIRSDWGGSENVGDRDLRILQAKDTTYSGVFASSNDRVRDVYVAPGETAGTLTLSGTQTANNGLTIESGAAVNLTGTWIGATTVAGTIGGSGTVAGDLTINDRGKINAANGAVTVNGILTVSDNARVEVHFNSAPARGAAIMSVVDTDSMNISSSATFEVYVDGMRRNNLKVKNDGKTLRIGFPGTVVNIF